MRDSCQFLKSDQFRHELRCSAGVNFAFVGSDRAVCRVCPLAELGHLPLCPNADVYTFLTGSLSGTARVEVTFACLADAVVRATAQCAQCPEQAVASGPAP